MTISSFMDDLRTASWRGIPFAVISADSEFGRRNHVHEYPFKDTVWVEDLGRSARKIALIGYLVENDLIYGGPGGSEKIADQRDRLVAAAEAGNDGKLIHPTLGELTVSLLKLGISERLTHLGVMEVGFSFIEAGIREFPKATQQTQSATLGAADNADAAAAADFNAAPGDLQSAAAESASGGWLDKVSSLASDASSFVNEMAQLPGEFGRFLGSEADSIFGSGTVSGFGTAFSSVREVISGLTILRGGLTSAIAKVVFGGASLLNSAGGFASSIQGICSLLSLGAQLPADAMRIFTSLADYHPTPLVGSSPLVVNSNTAAAAVAALVRRTAVIALSRVSARYQPLSYDDAAAIRATICAMLDAEITFAGDAPADTSYTALRDLRVAVSDDLTTRGASLAPIVTVSFKTSLPSLVIAQRLYQDPDRSNELESEANVRHPGFMPRQFRALAA